MQEDLLLYVLDKTALDHYKEVSRIDDGILILSPAEKVENYPEWLFPDLSEIKKKLLQNIHPLHLGELSDFNIRRVAALLTDYTETRNAILNALSRDDCVFFTFDNLLEIAKVLNRISMEVLTRNNERNNQVLVSIMQRLNIIFATNKCNAMVFALSSEV